MKKGRAVKKSESKGKRPSALELVVILSGVVTAIGAFLGGLAALLSVLK
jgi:hypothetical protein